MREAMTGVALWLGYVIVMPVLIYGCEVIAWPMWDTLNGGQSLSVTRVAALVSLVFTVTAYYVLIVLYRHRSTQVCSVP